MVFGVTFKGIFENMSWGYGLDRNRDTEYKKNSIIRLTLQVRHLNDLSHSP